MKLSEETTKKFKLYLNFYGNSKKKSTIIEEALKQYMDKDQKFNYWYNALTDERK